MSANTLTHDDLSLVTIEEAAQIVGVKRHTVYSWIRRGHLTTIRRGHRVLVSERKLLDCEHARRTR